MILKKNANAQIIFYQRKQEIFKAVVDNYHLTLDTQFNVFVEVHIP